MRVGGTQTESVKDYGFDRMMSGAERAIVSLGDLFVAKRTEKGVEVSTYSPMRSGDAQRSMKQNCVGFLSLSEDEARRLALQLFIAIEGANLEPLSGVQPELTLTLQKM